MPRLWDQTIGSHRLAVRDTILDVTGSAVRGQGLRSVTMSNLAARAGIGRATLYKHFPDVDAVLLAWHEREIARHIALLQEARNSAADPAQRLQAVLQAYAEITHEVRGAHDADLAGLLHRDGHLAKAEHQLREMFRSLIEDAVASGRVRDDVSPSELVAFVLRATGAAAELQGKAGISRLVDLTLSALRPQR